MKDSGGVIMPNMGETIATGTITKWLVQVGDRIERDQPLFEISTDKVDAEVPSPATGVLTQIYHPVGATVPVHTIVGWIGEGFPDTAPPLPPAPPPRPSAPPRQRTLWIVVTVFFSIRLLWSLHRFRQGEVEIYESLVPAAALLFSAAQLLESRGLFYRLLVLTSMILFLAFIVAFARVYLV